MKNTASWVLGMMVLGAGLAWAGDQPAQTAPAATPAVTTPPAAPAASPAAVVKVEKIAVGTAIDNKEISGEAVQFADSVTQLYCWSKVTADPVPATIKHVWSADGQKVDEISLTIKYPSTRTWSSKHVWPAAWKVEVVDDSGKVLESKEFTVAAAAQAASQAAPAATPPAAPKQVGQ